MICTTIHLISLVSMQDLVATVSPEKAATEVLINAHQHDITCISMNQQGSMIATCSSKVSSERGNYLYSVAQPQCV